MISLNFIKTVKAKTLLILSLIGIIILLSIISFVFKKKKQPPALPSPKPTATSLPAFNPQSEPIDDPLIGKKMEQIYQQKPWLKKLPIETKNYVISYNWEKQAIRIRPIIDSNSQLSYNDQIKKIKKDTDKRLKEIGVDLNQVKKYYLFSR